MALGMKSALGAGTLGVGGFLTAKALTGGGRTPQGAIQDFDPETKALLEKQKQRAEENADQIVARETEGADQKAMDFMGASQAIKPQANAALALNPMAADLDQALAKRAERQYKDVSGLSKIRRKMDANEKMIKAQAGAASAVGQQTRQKMEAYSTHLKNQAAKKQARSQMLGSVLGLAGTAAGAYFGGPAGMAAGGSIGKGVGESL